MAENQFNLGYLCRKELIKNVIIAGYDTRTTTQYIYSIPKNLF